METIRRRVSAAVIVLFLAISLTASGGAPGADEPLIRLANTDADPEKEVVIENAWYRMVVKPSLGASAVSFVAKPSGTEMLLPDAKFGAGLMADILREQGFGGEWQSAYETEIRSAGPAQGTVVFRRRGTGNAELQRLTLTRTLHVSSDSPVIGVNVDIHFDEGGARHFPLRYGVQNRVGNREKPTQCFFPTLKGIDSLTYRYSEGGGTQQRTVTNPPRHWEAAIVGGEAGLAFRMSPEQPETLYSYAKARVLTLEWGYEQKVIRHTQSWVLGYRIIPFNGLPRVDGVLDGLVGAVTTDGVATPGQPLRGRVLVAGETTDCAVELEWSRLPGTEQRPLQAKTIQVRPGAPTEIPFELPLTTAGTYVIRARLLRDGKALGVIERAFDAGQSSGRYTLLPESRRTDQLGPTTREGAIALKPGASVRVEKVLPVDCRLVRGFAHAPVDGRVDTRHAEGGISEWSRYGLPAVSYGEFNGNNGMHVTLAQDGFNALLVRGGWQGRLYAEADTLTPPGPQAPVLCEIQSQRGVFRKSFDPAVRARRLSFFYTQEQSEPLADVTFLRVTPGAGAGADGERETFGMGEAANPDEAVHEALETRFGPAYRLHHLTAGATGTAALAKGEFIHLMTPPQDPSRGIAAIRFELNVGAAEAGSLLTVRVQDVLDLRRESMGVDFVVAGPGRYSVLLDVPDQVFLPPRDQWRNPPRLDGVIAPPPALWISLASDAAMKLDGIAVTLHRVPREKAVGEAGAWRKFLLRGLFSTMSEPRPWMHLVDKKSVREQIRTSDIIRKYETSLIEVLETVEIARQLLPDDDVVRQYHGWIYQNMDRRKPQPPAKFPEVAGAPAWAVQVREGWLELRTIAQWWLDHRAVPGGLFGGGINDDTDLFQTWQCLPMIESEPLGARLKAAAAELSDTACAQTLEEGINKRTQDGLHAYEEGVNQLALCAWWFYGDPVHFERAMVSARSAMKLTVETKDGRVHFGGQMLGIDQARNGFEKLGTVDARAYPDELFVHPMFEVAWYNRHPAVLARYERLGETWRAYQKPGEFVGKVDIVTGKPAGASKTPAGPVDQWLALHLLTGDPKWLQPIAMGMDTDGYWGFQASYGRSSEALIRWDDASQEKLRKRFSTAGTGYAAFFLNKDRALLGQWLSDAVSWHARYRYMNTDAEQKTDRVLNYNASTPISCYLGDAPNRNRWLRNTAVSYENLRGEDFAALVWDAGPDTLRVAVYNFNAKPLAGRMRLWRLDHGRYRVKLGPDANDDGVMDAATEERTAELQRYSPIMISLPPKQVTMVQIDQIERLDDIRQRADLALSPREVVIKDGVLRAVAHNIGVRPVAAVEAAVLDADGKVVARQSLGELAAPLDLVPRTKAFTITLPGAPRKGWRLVLDPDGAVPEIFEGNNSVALGGPGT